MSGVLTFGQRGYPIPGLGNYGGAEEKETQQMRRNLAVYFRTGRARGASDARTRARFASAKRAAAFYTCIRPLLARRRLSRAPATAGGAESPVDPRVEATNVGLPALQPRPDDPRSGIGARRAVGVRPPGARSPGRASGGPAPRGRRRRSPRS